MTALIDTHNTNTEFCKPATVPNHLTHKEMKQTDHDVEKTNQKNDNKNVYSNNNHKELHSLTRPNWQIWQREEILEKKKKKKKPMKNQK